MTNPLMKSLILLSIGILSSGMSWAQQSPSTTVPRSNTFNTAIQPGKKPNRQQELYDQYHGYNKKTTESTPTPSVNEPVRPTRSEPIAGPTETAGSVPARTQAISQDSRARIGVRGGVTYPVFLDNVTGADPSVDFVGGAVFQFGRGRLSFQPEINYSRSTAKVDPGFGIVKASSDQVIVPLFLKIASGTFDGNRFFVNVGPYGAYLASVSWNGLKREIPSNVGRFSYGSAAGVGAMLKAGPGHVTVEVRGMYQLGDNTRGFYTDYKTIFTETTVGYIIPLGGR
ncbi:porin family protein [Spirosoma oryzicola]|uniref:porin family protein n=1 Tax=Spirosoma oryzicola TaxID=2898794 RepID=UPI001E53EA7F|nr:porin family protein [Spirosoma oryzicola]